MKNQNECTTFFEFGNANLINRESLESSGPPEGFIDNTVYRYRLDENGNKVFIGTMPAFPEGWNNAGQSWAKPFQKGQDERRPYKTTEEVEEEMTRYNWAELWPQVQDLLAENKNIKQIAEMLEIDVQVLRCKIDREKRKKERQKRIVAEEKQAKPRPSTDELQRLWDKYDGKINPIAKELGVSWAQVRQWLIDAGIITSSSGLISGLKQQTPEPEPVAVGSQEPVQNTAEPAESSLSQPPSPVKEQGFGPEDNEPIPYTVVPKVWTEWDKEYVRKLKAEGLSMRQIAKETGFTLHQIRHFFEREAKKHRPQQNDVLTQYKVKWIRDVMLDDLDPGVQLQIVAAVQGLEI